MTPGAYEEHHHETFPFHLRCVRNPWCCLLPGSVNCLLPFLSIDVLLFTSKIITVSSDTNFCTRLTITFNDDSYPDYTNTDNALYIGDDKSLNGIGVITNVNYYTYPLSLTQMNTHYQLLSSFIVPTFDTTTTNSTT